MTLDCNPNHTMYTSKVSSTQSNRPRFPNPQQAQPNSNLSRRTMMRESSGGSFLQRLLEIERRHDEKRMFRQKAAAKNNDFGTRSSNNTPVLAFPRSPTRWISEQIFDDTQETKNCNRVEGASFDDKSQQHFYPSACCRLPNLSDVRVISSNSSNTDPSSSSVFLSTNKQADSEYPMGSLSSLSYVELQQPSDDFPTRSPAVRKRPLRLPPIFLPPIYTLRPRPLKERDFLTPTRIRGPITDDEWDDLHQCRYIRPAPPGRFHIPSSSQVSLL